MLLHHLLCQGDVLLLRLVRRHPLLGIPRLPLGLTLKNVTYVNEGVPQKHIKDVHIWDKLCLALRTCGWTRGG
jgi:hypothetical protein